MTRFEVKEMQKLAGGVENGASGAGGVLISGVEPGQWGPEKIVRAKNVITCAGLHMDWVGQVAGTSLFALNCLPSTKDRL